MNVAEEQDRFEKEKAEQIVAETPLMDGIERVSVELGDDHSGDPAMWLIFHTRHKLSSNDLDATDRWLRSFNEFSRQLSFKIIDSGLTRFPYTSLKEAA